MTEAFKNLSKSNAEGCFELIDLLLKNIIEKGDERRQIKIGNPKLQNAVSKHKQGVKLMELVGFTQEEGVWVNRGSMSYLKGIRLDF